MGAQLCVACAHCGKPKTIPRRRKKPRNFCDEVCSGAWRNRGLTAIGKRRADDPYYAARDAAADCYDPEAHDRAILLERERDRRLLECR